MAEKTVMKKAVFGAGFIWFWLIPFKARVRMYYY